MNRVVRFFRSQNGWNTVVTLAYLAAVAGGYAWARSGEDSFERFCRTWLVMWESMAGCGVMLALYLSPPWFRKSHTTGETALPAKENA